MPEPRPAPRTAAPVPVWPDTLPDPQAGSVVTSPPRAEAAPVLFGPTRYAVKARTAPMSYAFVVWLTPLQFETFEEFYRDAIENHDGEFYAPWIGGARVVAFGEAYDAVPIGASVALSGILIRTRIDPGICDAILNEVFGAIYRADLAAPDIYQADLTAVDVYADNFDLQLIADNEC
jgi:hypothetical protein